jgi:hypothetical protein
MESKEETKQRCAKTKQRAQVRRKIINNNNNNKYK